jgi:ATP-dependent exoDNAse (exonuclease V) alpha subunit
VRLTDVDRLVTALVANPDVLPVVTDAAERRFTTRELVATEQHALALATSPTVRPVAAVDRETVMAVLAGSGLSDEQHAMVTALLTSGRRVDVVAGPAGSGKTVALATAAGLWSQAGSPVRGATVSWLAARNLHAATGIPSRSLASTLRAAERHGLPAGVVLVLDEASLVNTRTLAQLLGHVHAVDGKLVCVGDPAQLPEIGAGGIFATLAARDDTIRLSDNQRQQQPWERDALRRLRDGDTTGALDAYIDNGRVHTAPSTRTLLDLVADDYLTAVEAGEQVLVLAARRVDVTQLNTHIRDRLIEAGRLGHGELTITTADGDRSYRVGDHVLITANDRELGIVNGSRGTITALHPRRGSLQVHCDEGRDVVLDRDWLATGHLHHGYAATVHKAQGVTVDTTLIYGAGPLTHEHAYVALSRGRAANHLYLAADTIDHDQCGPQHDDAEEPQLVAELLERITISGAHQLASTQLAQPWHPPAHDPYDDDHLQRMHNYDPPDRGYGLGR